MAYFSAHENCHHYPDEWNRLLNYIWTKWKPHYRDKLYRLEHHIELKAFYVFTLSRHLIQRSEEMPKDGKWHTVFIETMMLLFPMLEIVGQARLGDLIGSSLGAGIDWLEDPVGGKNLIRVIHAAHR